VLNSSSIGSDIGRCLSRIDVIRPRSVTG